ncbi:MFS transporter, partial [Candidatus Marinamargulisbacteria bacterium SCGC AAA071-K20]
ILSLIGFSSILLTGLIGLFQLKPEYLAIKEALIPLIICIVVFSSQNSKYPIVIKLFEHLLDLDHIKSHLTDKDKEAKFQSVLKGSSTIVGLSFLVSSVLNYVLARVIVVSSPGSVAFNEELGKMTALSYPVIALPSSIILVIAIWFLIKKTQALTGLTLEELLKIK